MSNELIIEDELSDLLFCPSIRKYTLRRHSEHSQGKDVGQGQNLAFQESGTIESSKFDGLAPSTQFFHSFQLSVIIPEAQMSGKL